MESKVPVPKPASTLGLPDRRTDRLAIGQIFLKSCFLTSRNKRMERRERERERLIQNGYNQTDRQTKMAIKKLRVSRETDRDRRRLRQAETDRVRNK